MNILVLLERRRWSGAFHVLSTVIFVASANPNLCEAQEPPPTAEQFRALQQKVLELERELNELKTGKAAAEIRPETNTPAQLQELDQKLKGFERGRELDREAAGAKVKSQPTIRLDESGFSFISANENFKLRLRGYLQADARFYLHDSAHALTDTFLLNRVRPVFEGTVFRDFDFKMMPDFGQGRSLIQDAYVDAHFTPWFNVRAGKYKAPVGLERLQSARDLTFVERALPTAIAPNRDIGIWLHGEILKHALGYEVGVFNGAADRSSDDSDENDSKDIEGRLFAHPFKNLGIEPLAGLGLGVAGTTGHENGIAPDYRSVGQQTFFSFNSGVSAHGNRSRISPQGYYYFGPFGLLGEYIIAFEDVSKGALTRNLANSAWQVTASYVLTGEKASYTGIAPRKPFNPSLGQWGAFELAARVGQLMVDPDVFVNLGSPASPVYLADPKKSASEATHGGVGFNWYLNRGVKFMLDYDQTHFEKGAAHGDRDVEHALFSRIQLSF